MTTRTRKRLDYLPYLALIISAIYLIYCRITGDIIFQLRHWAGLVLLLIPIILFIYRHKLGVLSLGLIILLGLFGAISFSPAITTTTFGTSLGSSESFTLLYFQPIFLLWAVLHFTLSGRYYTGLISKRYWDNIKSDEPIKFGSE